MNAISRKLKKIAIINMQKTKRGFSTFQAKNICPVESTEQLASAHTSWCLHFDEHVRYITAICAQ